MTTTLASASVRRARELRRGMTDGERKLWAELRQFRRWYGIHVRRQVPFGKYIADFAIHEHRITIEVDGEHHFEPDGMARDRKRDEWFAGQGYTVLRFNTGEISDSFDGCIEEILHELGLMEAPRRPPPLTPPHKGEGNLGGAG